MPDYIPASEFNADDPQPGVYIGLPASVYHGCKAAVSRSTLRMFDEGDPAAVKRYIDKGTIVTSSMDRGSAVDVAIFDGLPAFHEQFAQKPKFTGTGSKARREAWEKETEDDGITYMTEAPYRTALAMVECIHENEVASALFGMAEPQLSIFWRDKDTGLLCKARPDAYVKDRAWSLDLKTTGSIDERSLGYTIRDYAADAQAAMVRDGLLANGMEWRGHLLVSVTGKAAVDGTHDMRHDLLSETWIDYGEIRFQRWLRMYHDCITSGEWPGRADGVNVLPLPKWMAHDLEELTHQEDQERARRQQERKAS